MGHRTSHVGEGPGPNVPAQWRTCEQMSNDHRRATRWVTQQHSNAHWRGMAVGGVPRAPSTGGQGGLWCQELLAHFPAIWESLRMACGMNSERMFRGGLDFPPVAAPCASPRGRAVSTPGCAELFRSAVQGAVCTPRQSRSNSSVSWVVMGTN